MYVPMSNKTDIELSLLLDMLASHTNEYLRMFKEGAPSAEFNKCKEMIEQLTSEIESRKQAEFRIDNASRE